MNIRDIFKQHIAFIILCLILFTYLGVKTLPENGWSGWGIFSAQTLLSSKHWVNDGFIYSKLLFIPIGYSKVVQYLDQPAMRQHARGTTTGKLIGNRLYYTHYPPGYLFPYALLMKLGFNQRYWFRLLALIFSFSALILLYVFFNLITRNSLISFFAIAYYALSTMFLDYADSLANQPIDDLLRAAILVVSMLALRLSSGQALHSNLKSKIYNLSIWLLYFILSLSSYDSTFFVFVWLVGLDIITMWSPALSGVEPAMKKISKIFSTAGKKWLFFASAPILAFVLQIMQNWWYLGWGDMWMDIKGAFLFRSSDGPGGNFLEKHIRSMFSPLSNMVGLRVRFALPLILTILGSFVVLRKKIFSKVENLNILLILFLAGVAFAFVFVGPGYFPYQGRQWMIWFSLLMGMSASLLRFLKFDKFRMLTYRELRIPFIVLLISFLIAWGFQLKQTFAYVKDWPNRKVSAETINFYKELKSLTRNDAIIFDIDNNLKTDYSQPDPIEEYYVDRPILNFKNFQDALRDYLWLKKYSVYKFDVIIVSSDENATRGFLQILSAPDDIREINNKFVGLISN